MRVPIIDWICPSPQSGRPGWRTKSPGVSTLVNGFHALGGQVPFLTQRGRENSTIPVSLRIMDQFLGIDFAAVHYN